MFITTTRCDTGLKQNTHGNQDNECFEIWMQPILYLLIYNRRVNIDNIGFWSAHSVGINVKGGSGLIVYGVGT